jgi:hypothetical protein
VRRVQKLLLRYEDDLHVRLPRLISGLLAFALVAANPPGITSAPTPAPRLVAAVSSAAVFLGHGLPGLLGVESSALAMVAASGGLSAGPQNLARWLRSGNALVGTGSCPPGDLVVSWVPPVGNFQVGAYIEPLGPEPTAETIAVNGIVGCRSSSFAFVGFEAAWDGVRWRLAAVPSLADETSAPLLAGEASAEGATPAESGSGQGAEALPPASDWGGLGLEPLAPYVPQTTCDPTAKRGVLGFRDLLLSTFPGSRNLGIGRVCEAEGVSEHKEGRAFDWGVSADDPAERASADAVLSWMLGPDETGEFAISRRLGLMYVIWDRQIWSAFMANEGWRPYVGVNAHRDHIHFSFDWPGAMAETSFWQGGKARKSGSVVPDLPLIPIPPRPGPLPLDVPASVVAPGAPPAPPAAKAPASRTAPLEGGGAAPAPESTTTSTTPAPPPTSTTTTTAPIVTFPSPPPSGLGF